MKTIATHSSNGLPPLPAFSAMMLVGRRIKLNLRIVRQELHHLPHLVSWRDAGYRRRWLVERVERLLGRDDAEQPWRVWLYEQDARYVCGPDWDATFLLTPETYRRAREILL